MSAIPVQKRPPPAPAPPASQPRGASPAAMPAAAAPSETVLAPQVLALARLAELEWETRKAVSPNGVDFIAANDTYRVVAYDHAVVWRARAGRIVAVSGGVTLDGTAPRLHWFGALARHCAATLPRTAASDIDRERLPAALKRSGADHLSGHAVWVPFAGTPDSIEGGAILIRRSSFNDAERRVLGRLGSAFGQAHAAHAARPARRRPLLKAGLAGALLAAAAATAAVPVPLALLAEARVVARDPEIVAAPLDGVIADIPVEPNASVSAGTLMVRFDRTEFAAAEDVARGRVAVLTADLARLEQQAFADERARADVAIARARLAEGRTELDLARDRLARTDVRSRSAGVVELEDRQAWLGRPVRVGERILAIANPTSTELELDVAADDALLALPGASVSLFLASAPADPVPATLTHVGFAPVTEPGALAIFKARARFAADGATPGPAPRLGLTGTARIEGARVWLGYALIRKPWAALRRFTGL